MSLKFFENKYLLIVLAFLFIVLGFVLYEEPAGEPLNIETVAESSELYEINAEYPTGDVVGVDGARNLVMDKISEFKIVANRTEEEVRSRGIVASFSLDLSLENYETESYISYVFYVSEYTGGANVNNIVLTLNYDKSSGEQITLSEILPDEDQGEFVSDVRSRLLRKEESGIFQNVVERLSIDSLKSFYITEESITVLFSKYVVAPGAAGIVEVTIPRK